MAYLVRWGCFVMDDSLSPTEAAKWAQGRVSDPRHQTWHVNNLENNDSIVVDLANGTTKGPNRAMCDDGVVRDNVA